MTLKEQKAAKVEELKALEDQIKAEDPDAIKAGAEIAEAIESIEASIENAEKAQEILNAIGTETQSDDTEEKEMGAMDTLLEQAKGVNKSIKGWSAGAHFKSATDVVTSERITDYDRSVAPQPARRVAADLFTNAVISGNAITYFLQGAYEGAPAVTAEGAKKPQNSTSFDSVTLALSKIAAYIKETDEIILDNDFLASEVRNSLIYQLGIVEDAHVVNTVETTSGVLSGTYGSGSSSIAATLVDGILYGIKAVKANSAYSASAILLNPADMFTLMTSKDQNNQYYGGGYFQNMYGQGAYPDNYVLWGVPVFESSEIAAGSAVIAAKQAVKVWRKGGLDVKLYEQNEDDALYNRVTLLAEERLAVAVTDKNGVFHLTAE